MPYTHYAHLKDKVVDVGMIVDAGTCIGHVGDSGAPGNSHLHFEVQKLHPSQHPNGAYVGYTKGMDSIAVQQYYENPDHYLEGKPSPLTNGVTTGYKFLQKNAQGLLHPGNDMNRGSGYDDYGDAVVAVERSRVIAIRYDVGANGQGWGTHIFLEPLSKQLTKEEMEELNKLRVDHEDYVKKNNERADRMEDLITKTFPDMFEKLDKRLDKIEEALGTRVSKKRVAKLEDKVEDIKQS